MKRCNELLLFALAEALKPMLLLLMYFCADSIGSLTTFFRDLHKDHPAVRLMWTPQHISPPFKRIDQPGDSCPGDDQPVSDFIGRQRHLRVSEYAEDKRRGRREIERLNQLSDLLDQQFR